jgi:uncharacterized protein (TIGR03435 family)
MQASLPRLSTLSGRDAGAGPPAEASEPSAALSFSEALGTPLLLKLEMHKRTEPVVVIDQVNQKPTDN